ncbi:hypothetical protein Bbelb_008270 [Branchiostoma belcheri]|nr:hypothetical protein Bbelb_008270 [Branchiostoma belcheri]
MQALSQRSAPRKLAGLRVKTTAALSGLSACIIPGMRHDIPGRNQLTSPFDHRDTVYDELAETDDELKQRRSDAPAPRLETLAPCTVYEGTVHCTGSQGFQPWSGSVAPSLFQPARRLFQLVVCFSQLIVCFSKRVVCLSSSSVLARRLFQLVVCFI